MSERTILETLRTLVADVAGVAEVKPTDTLLELGFDSLMAVEVINGVEQDLGVRIPMQQLLKLILAENSTLERLAEALLPGPEIPVELPQASIAAASGAPGEPQAASA